MYYYYYYYHHHHHHHHHHQFPAPWYFFPWTNGTPHNSSLQVSYYSTFLIIRDVPSRAVFCRWSIECLPGIVCSLSVTISVAPMITGMTKRFIFHNRWICILRFSYFNFFFQPAFVLHSYLTVLLCLSISKFYVLFLMITSDLLTITCLYPFISQYCCIFLFT
jgi:hypothetical protein